MSNIVNRVKNALSGDSPRTGTANRTMGTTGTMESAEGVAGPHSSRLANTLDPRVDSEMDGSRRIGTTTGTTGTTGTMGTAEGVAGPHSSRLANTVDPRVDSDMDGSRRTGTATGTTGTTGNAQVVAGPHSSRLANMLDPRVDSGMDGSHHAGGATAAAPGVAGGNTYTTSTTGTTGTTSGLGPHSSSLLNKLDPRVDSTTGAVKTLGTIGTTGTTGTTGVTGTTGTHAHNGVAGNNYTGTTGGLSSSTNVGPHNSNLANKLDPRVDSNMDGSVTAGANRTYAGRDHKDPLNAAHFPPSVLRRSIGDPVITHDDLEHNHQGRHGSLSHQEAHLRG